MDPKEAVEVLRGSMGFLYAHGMTHVNDAIDAVLAELEQAQRERDKARKIERMTRSEREREAWMLVAPAIKRAEAAEARVAALVGALERVKLARYAILSAYHDGPPEALPAALQELADALDLRARAEAGGK